MKRTIQTLALAALLASWLFPWFVEYSTTGHRLRSVGVHFLFADSYRVERVDFSRLFLLDLCIVAVAGAALHLTRKEE